MQEMKDLLCATVQEYKDVKVLEDGINAFIGNYERNPKIYRLLLNGQIGFGMTPLTELLNWVDEISPEIKALKIRFLVFLIKSGADVNIPMCMGSTALHDAVSLNFIEAVRILVEAGADVGAWGRNASTALDIAREKEFSEITDYLSKKTEKDPEKEKMWIGVAPNRHAILKFQKGKKRDSFYVVGEEEPFLFYTVDTERQIQEEERCQQCKALFDHVLVNFKGAVPIKLSRYREPLMKKWERQQEIEQVITSFAAARITEKELEALYLGRFNARWGFCDRMIDVLASNFDTEKNHAFVELYEEFKELGGKTMLEVYFQVDSALNPIGEHMRCCDYVSPIQKAKYNYHKQYAVRAFIQALDEGEMPIVLEIAKAKNQYEKISNVLMQNKKELIFNEPIKREEIVALLNDPEIRHNQFFKRVYATNLLILLIDRKKEDLARDFIMAGVPCLRFQADAQALPAISALIQQKRDTAMAFMMLHRRRDGAGGVVSQLLPPIAKYVVGKTAPRPS